MDRIIRNPLCWQPLKTGRFRSSGPTNFMQLGATLYFAAIMPAMGRELVRAAIARGLEGGTFDLPQRYETNRMPFAVAIADFNRDGALDVVVANKEGSGTAY
jgi:hypothetical protein